ncbi:uncharacterized protein LOC128552195 [Mercenaria mercenaria]|uniref:uncharacterized protein LOC128552195 n=1 Tax=Mercenaria mercenaria TaxID=6596 RepID=UPI00234F42FC|nr:uncharacterized protein LOC128552195 [Mercenaria mercenaria]
MDADRQVCAKNALTMYEQLDTLGFVINKQKSVLVPTQRITYFGYILDSVLFMVFLPEDKILKILKTADYLLSKTKIKIRDLSAFIGLLINAFHAVLEAPLHYRTLERFKVRALKISPDFDSLVELGKNEKQEILWWKQNIHAKNGKKIRQKPVSLWILSDASNIGFGSSCLQKEGKTGGRWTTYEAQNHINYLELLAIFFALKSWAVDQNHVHIGVQSDSTTAIAYINNLGGMQNKAMDMLAKEIWQWCISRNLFVTAYHLPGCENVEADYMSRNFSDTTEWMLKRQIYSRLTSQLFMPNIDLFASRLNAQIEKYVSWTPDPNALCSNAFSLDWSVFKPYVFPPFRLLGKVLNKIREDHVDKVLIIGPYWTNQTWFPLLLHCLISVPIRLPRHRDIVTLPHNGAHHPMGKNLQLFGAIVSGNPLRIEESQQMLQKQSLTVGVSVPENSIQGLGRNGHFGVVFGTVIPFNHLKK